VAARARPLERCTPIIRETEIAPGVLHTARDDAYAENWLPLPKPLPFAVMSAAVVLYDCANERQAETKASLSSTETSIAVPIGLYLAALSNRFRTTCSSLVESPVS
jgi:hypothetical protein